MSTGSFSRAAQPSPRLVPFVRSYRSVRGGDGLLLEPDDGAQLIVSLSAPLRFRAERTTEVVAIPPRAARWLLACDGRLDAVVVRFLPGAFLPSGHGGFDVEANRPVALDHYSSELSHALQRELGPTLSDDERLSVCDAVLERALSRLRGSRVRGAG